MPKTDCYPLRSEPTDGYYLISNVSKSAQGEFWGTCYEDIYSNAYPMKACHGVISGSTVSYDYIIDIDPIDGENVNTFFPVELPDGSIDALMTKGIWYTIENAKLINFDPADPNSYTVVATLNGAQMTSGMDYKNDDCSVNIAMGTSSP